MSIGRSREAAQYGEPTSGLEPLTPAPATSLLESVLARPSASGNCACLGGFRRSGSLTLSIVYQCVSALLQYGLQYLRGRDEVMRQWSIHDPVYRSKTQHVGVCHRV